MSEKTVQECIRLEKYLSKYELWADMVPKSSHYKNLRSAFSRKEWDIIKKAVYKKDGYKCSICGVENVRLEAHEEWKYNYKKFVQKLVAINTLCFYCHQNKHLGHAFILADEGKLDRERLLSYWSVINNKPLESSRDYFIKILRLWELRNNFDWIIVDNKDKEITKEVEFSNILELITNKFEES